MSNGFALNIGLNFVDPTQYGGWDGELAGCVNDATAMQSVLDATGFSTRLILNNEATSSAVLDGIRQEVLRLQAGDLLAITYAGHGGQRDDFESDEEDGKDETWVLWDREVLDDELNEIYQMAPAGSGIVIVSDSCHSATIARDMVYAYSGAINRARASLNREHVRELVGASASISNARLGDQRDATSPFGGSVGDRVARLAPITLVAERSPSRARAISFAASSANAEINAHRFHAIKQRLGSRSGRSASRSMQCSVVVMSGCQDNQTSLDGAEHGLFTEKLLDVWAAGSFTADYRQFHSRIATQMPPEQSPQIDVFGAGGEGLAVISALRIPRSGWLSGATSTPTQPTVPLAEKLVLPNDLSSVDDPPGLSVSVPAGRWYEIELADRESFLGTESAFGSWMLSETHNRSAVFQVPQEWWDSLRESPELWGLIHTCSSSTGWDGYRVSEATWVPIRETRTRDDEVTVSAPESVFNDADAPELWIETGSTPFYEIEFAADVALFDNESLRTSDSYCATWELGSWSGKLSGNQQSIPSEAWVRLKFQDCLYIRAHASSTFDDWENYRVSNYALMGIKSMSTPTNGPIANTEPARAMSIADAFAELVVLHESGSLTLVPAPSGSGATPARVRISPSTLHGVEYRYWDGKKTLRHGMELLDPRNALALARLARWAAENHGVTEIHHLGLSGSSTRNDCHGQGRALDFAGIKGVSADGNEFVWNVLRDWGNKSVPDESDPAGARLAKWPAGTRTLTFRLDGPDADPTAAEFFRQLYEFCAGEWQDQDSLPSGRTQTSAIGQRSFIMNPDHPASKPGTPNGREAHANHLHLQIGPTGPA